MKIFAILIMGLLFAGTSDGCAGGASGPGPATADYVWSQVAEKASFPEGYNYPVFTFGDRMVAMNNGAWLSSDGKVWTKTELPDSGLSAGYQKYLQFQGAVYALGSMTGNYEDLHLTTRIARTRDFRTWETLSEVSNLPHRVFYGAAVYQGKIWLAGGFDGRKFYNDVWNSADGIHWVQVAQHTDWSARGTSLVVFKDRLWLIGGGVIDGDPNPNPNSDKEIWASSSGVNWFKIKTGAGRKWGGTPVVFDDKLWLMGANRNDGNFSNALWVTNDGINWENQSAPWSPRGGVAAWQFSGKLFITGGKFSETVNGDIKFIYSNDVWSMSKKQTVPDHGKAINGQ